MDVNRCLFPSTRLCGGAYFYYCAQTLSSFFLSSWMEKKIGRSLTDVLWYPLLLRIWLFKTLKRGRSHQKFSQSFCLVSLRFVLLRQFIHKAIFSNYKWIIEYYLGSS